MAATIQPVFNNGSTAIKLSIPLNSTIGTTSTVVFGLLGVFASAITVWQGHRAWKYRHRRGRTSEDCPRAWSSSIELHMIEEDSTAWCPTRDGTSSSAVLSKSSIGSIDGDIEQPAAASLPASPPVAGARISES